MGNMKGFAILMAAWVLFIAPGVRAGDEEPSPDHLLRSPVVGTAARRDGTAPPVASPPAIPGRGAGAHDAVTATHGTNAASARGRGFGRGFLPGGMLLEPAEPSARVPAVAITRGADEEMYGSQDEVPGDDDDDLDLSTGRGFGAVPLITINNSPPESPGAAGSAFESFERDGALQDYLEQLRICGQLGEQRLGCRSLSLYCRCALYPWLPPRA